MSRSADPRIRRRIVTTMARLLRRQGYAATGLAQIISESGAPKGSLYHYFSGGKEQIAAEALVHAGALVQATLDALRQTESNPPAIIRAYGALLEGWMSKSGFADGCPLTTTLLETAPARTRLAAIGSDAFAAWQDVFAAALRDAGVPAARADDLALAALMMIEGALVLARVRREATPIRVTTMEIAALFAREMA